MASCTTKPWSFSVLFRGANTSVKDSKTCPFKTPLVRARSIWRIASSSHRSPSSDSRARASEATMSRSEDAVLAAASCAARCSCRCSPTQTSRRAAASPRRARAARSEASRRARCCSTAWRKSSPLKADRCPGTARRGRFSACWQSSSRPDATSFASSESMMCSSVYSKEADGSRSRPLPAQSLAPVAMCSGWPSTSSPTATTQSHARFPICVPPPAQIRCRFSKPRTCVPQRQPEVGSP
mmetsp:Transcript_49419/g.159481  ORF Transcript_49419/g.159481 Transcript_49419/m.159481 type:complete len:240 (-) Transcript_49419:30-749(-)